MKVNGSRHFVMIGGVVVAIIGVSLIYALPNSYRVARLMSVLITGNPGLVKRLTKHLQWLLPPGGIQRHVCADSQPYPGQCCGANKEDRYYFFCFY